MAEATISDGNAPAAIGAWFDLLYPAGLGAGYLSLFSINRSDGTRYVDWAASGAEAAATCAERAGLCDVWAGVAPRRERLGGARRGGDDDCLFVPGLWLDVDIAGPTHHSAALPPTMDAAHQLVASYPVPPSVVVGTGGGLQPWWLFSEPLPAAEAKPLLLRWGATWVELAGRLGWRVDNVFDLARVLRVPGTTNRKGTPAPVVLLRLSSQRYEPEQLDEWTVEPPAAPTPVARRLPYIGPERPGDAYNARHTGSEVLAGEGWTLRRRDHSGDEAWLHPWGATSDCSATVYADGHTTLWSDTVPQHWPAAVTRRPYDPFGLLAVARYGGDYPACARALEGLGYGTPHIEPLVWPPAEDGAAIDPLLALLIDWPTFWRKERLGEAWLAYPLVPQGRAVALYAPAKTGKSLLALDVAAAVATGRPVLGGASGPPRHVLYLDYEMTEDDLEERLQDLGYTDADDLVCLHYALLPTLPPLNKAAGAEAVLRLAALVGADLVVIDTLGRAVEGEENASDTLHDFYAHTGLKLKAAGRSLLRTDHAGKDLDRGQRGTSAKNDDVDVVYQLTRTMEGLVLRATHRRLAWVPEMVRLRIQAEPVLAHLLCEEHDWPEGTPALAAQLEGLGLPAGASANAAEKAMRAAGISVRRARLQAAVRYRKLPQDGPRLKPDPAPDGPGTTPGTIQAAYKSVPGRVPTGGTLPDLAVPPPVPPGTTSAGKTGTDVPPLRGYRIPKPSTGAPKDDETEGPNDEPEGAT